MYFLVLIKEIEEVKDIFKNKEKSYIKIIDFPKVITIEQKNYLVK